MRTKFDTRWFFAVLCAMAVISFFFVNHGKPSSKILRNSNRSSNNVTMDLLSGFRKFTDLFSKSKDKKPDTNMVYFPTAYTDDTLIMKMLPPLRVIPKILHITWPSADSVPTEAIENLRQWRLHHPDWTFVFWNDTDMIWFMNSFLSKSKHLNMWNKLPHKIMKVDSFRYQLLYIIGGVYADLDVRPVRPLDPVMDYHSCIIGREPEPHSTSTGRDSTVLASNYFMASRPGHPFWPFLWQFIVNRGGNLITRVGPVAVSDATGEFSRNFPFSDRIGSLFLAPSMYFDPPVTPKGKMRHVHITKNACRRLLRRKPSEFTKHVCNVAFKENRLFLNVGYVQNRYFKESLTKHLMFGSYDKDTILKKMGRKPLDKKKLRLTSPRGLLTLLPIKGTYEEDQYYLKHPPINLEDVKHD